MKNQTSPVVRPVTFENAGGIRAGADAGSQGRRRAYRAFGRIPVPVVQLCRRLHVRREPRAAGHDRMGVFNTRDGGFRLVRNHKDRNAPGAGSTALAPGKSYDMNGGAGTTTLVVNPFTRELQRDFVSSSGTIVNCRKHHPVGQEEIGLVRFVGHGCTLRGFVARRR